MGRITPEIRNFAERLIAYETRRNRSSGTKAPVACLVVDKLRPQLALLMGNIGFRALLSRTLALSKTEFPWLRAVHVKPEGSLEGLDELGTQVNPDEISKGCLVLLAQMLGLLVTFIGEDLTLRLVQEVWPKLSLNSLDAGKGER